MLISTRSAPSGPHDKGRGEAGTLNRAPSRDRRCCLSLEVAFIVLGTATCISPARGGGPAIDLTLQTRHRGTGRIVVTKERIDPARIGVVIIDMWNTNDCMTNAQRCAALVPRMNKALEGARRLGMQIVWAPTDVASQYAGTPQRERAIALPLNPVPHIRDYSCPFSVPTDRPSKCMCGPGIVCHLHYGWERMDPNLLIAAGDWIVGGKNRGGSR